MVMKVRTRMTGAVLALVLSVRGSHASFEWFARTVQGGQPHSCARGGTHKATQCVQST